MKKIKTFGNWEINEYGISFLGNYISNHKDSHCDKNTLWDTRDNKWEWIIHLSSKNWVTNEEMDNFIEALKYAQEHFKELAPNGIENISLEESI